MNLPVITAGLTAGMLAVTVASTYLDGGNPNAAFVSTVSRSSLFMPASIADDKLHSVSYLGLGMLVETGPDGSTQSTTIIHSQVEVTAM